MEAICNQVGIGLHYTTPEVKNWQERAEKGPYKVGGDAQPNSPGDWTRITANAKTFLANPTPDKYSQNVWKSSGCVPDLNDSGYSSSQDPVTQGDHCRDAAFYYLVKGDLTYATAVRTYLLSEASNPLLDFTNKNRWCPGGLNDLNPGFMIAEWETRLLFAYDYIKAILTSADKIKLNAWFLGLATYLKSNLDPYIDKLFVNRAAGNYTLSSATLSLEKGSGSTMYYGGPDARYTSRQYNNRRVALAGGMGMAGLMLGNAPLVASAKRFFKEVMMFGIYPTGYYVDFTRGSTSSPEKGYAYATLHEMYPFADSLARAGDTELLDLLTKEGTTAATSGKDASTDGTTLKGFKMHIKAMLDLRNHVKSIYPSSSKEEKYRIDGVTPGGPYSVWDIMYCVPNLYYKDAYIKASYLRKTPGAMAYPLEAESRASVSYPSNPQPNGAVPVWTLGQYPGILFMFGQMEGKVWPYGQQPQPGKKNQTLVFEPVPDKRVGDPAFTLEAETSSELPPVFTTSDPSVIAVSGKTATVVGEGDVVLTASQPGNAEYNPATPQSQTVSVFPRVISEQVLSRLTLVNADSEADLLVLADGAVLNLATLPSRNLNIRADTDPEKVGSVVFKLTGQQTRNQTEGTAPYALFGDVEGAYNAWVPDEGEYSLTATPYSEKSGGGYAGIPLTVTFSVIDQAPDPWVPYTGEVEINVITGELRKKPEADENDYGGVVCLEL